MEDDNPLRDSSGPDEVTKSFALLLRLIANQAAEIATIRFLLSERGVTNEDFEMLKGEVEKRWEAQTQPVIDRIRERRISEQLKDLLDKAGNAQH